MALRKLEDAPRCCSSRVALNTKAAAIIFCAVLGGGCAEEAVTEDAVYLRCKQDPSCRGQACVDARENLYLRGQYRSASMLQC